MRPPGLEKTCYTNCLALHFEKVTTLQKLSQDEEKECVYV